MFLFNAKSRIFLYGAATIGKIVCNNLLDSGFKVEKFIDMRFKEVEKFMNIPVVSIDSLNESEKKDAIIIISVKNVFEHKNIVKNLLERGYFRLIYMPDSVLQGKMDKDDQIIEKVYQGILKGNILSEQYIPETKMIKETYEYKDYAIIEMNEKSYVARVPWQLIFTNERVGKGQPWSGLNCAQLFPHIELFKFFGGDITKDEQEYIQFCCLAAEKMGDIETTDGWKKNVIKNRYDVYGNMNMMLELDPDFFIRSAPLAEWNERGKKFYLKSGKHRVSFLMSKGYKYIPLEILKIDYEAWCKAYTNEEKRTGEPEYDIWHPYTLKYPFDDVECDNNIQKCILEYISKLEYRIKKDANLTGINIGFDLQAFGENLFKLLVLCGANVTLLNDLGIMQKQYDYYIMDFNKYEELQDKAPRVSRGKILLLKEKSKLQMKSILQAESILYKGIKDGVNIEICFAKGDYIDD